jgi:hypothetical protein
VLWTLSSTARGALRALLAVSMLLGGFTARGADCDRNGVDDAIDIEKGTSADCNRNGIPDLCEKAPPVLGFLDESTPVAATMQVLLAADLDGDGALDLAAGSRGTRGLSAVTVLWNRGGGAFIAAEHPAGENLYSLAAADLDGDGALDLIAAGNASLTLLWNDGAGRFLEAVSSPRPAGIRALAAGDLDGDGFPDLATSSIPANTVAVLINRLGGSFADAASLSAGGAPLVLIAADIDGDGRLDLLAANRDSATVSLFRSRGGGAFAPAVHSPAGGVRPTFLAAADLDGDGRLDLLSATSTEIFGLFAEGEGRFAAPRRLAAAGSTLAAADLDDDGHIDLAVGARTAVVSVKVNDGRGGFDRGLDFTAPSVPRLLTAADLDGDGGADLALAASAPSSIRFLWNGLESGAVLAPLARSDVGLSGCADARGCRPHSGALGDLDGDGHIDAIGCNTHPGSFSVALNDGGGRLVFRGSNVFGGEHPQSVALGDLDGDGDLDAVTVDNLDHRFYVHLNDGTGRFTRGQTYPVGSAPLNVKLADLDGDGLLDGACANPGSGNVSVLFNKGGGVFESRGPRDIGIAGSPRALAAADLDGDGAIDLAVANSTAAQVAVLRNDGSGGFSARADHRLRGNPNDITIADLDGDGRPDIVTADTGTARVSVLLNEGKGRFAAAAEFLPGTGPYSVIAADLDRDGIPDLITGNESASSVSILPGLGGGSFAPGVQQAAGTGLRFVAAGDLDGDGDLDLVTFNREGQSFTVLHNQLPPPEEDYLEAICTPLEFHELSRAAARRSERLLKFTLAARDDPALLAAVFQNTRRFPLHAEFLLQAFPERFAALGPEEYEALVGRRASRDYFAGSLARIRTERGPLYVFSIHADLADPRELLSAAEVREIYLRLGRSFRLELLAYRPETPQAIEAAAGWEDPGFPIHLGELLPGGGYEAYTQATGYGRVRVLSRKSFDELNRSGRLSFQDILVLERTPADIEGVIGGAITAEPQPELSHLLVRTARRGTPNAYVARATEVFAPLDGKLVRLDVRRDGYTVEAVGEADAQAWWSAQRRQLERLPGIDAGYGALDDLDEIDVTPGGPGELTPEARYGGKAANFARLQRVLEGEWERYRARGFAVPMRHYLDFLRSNTIASAVDPARQVTYEEHIRELVSSPAFESDSALRFEALRRLRERMLESGRVDPALVTRLAVRVQEVFGTTREMVRFRSSSNIEDILEFSAAGLHDSTSACAADDLDADDVGPSRCDRTRPTERGIARALKQVWASLWNFRAYEERAFAGIPAESAAMGVLVSHAFGVELANGVAFTGDPANPRERRYVIVAQPGEASVVSPAPGVVSEKSLLEMAGGGVARIHRLRRSSLLPAGEHVLSDAELEELGALLWHLEQSFPVETGSHRREEVLLDIEFKLDAAPGGGRKLAVKQIRPFLLAAPAAPSPTFELLIPPGSTACGGYGRVARPPRVEYELKSLLRFRPGRIPLPSGAGSFAGELVDEIILGPGRERAAPASPGLFRAHRFGAPNQQAIHRFGFEQEFVLPGGERLDLQLSLLDYRSRDGVPLEASRSLDGELLIDEVFLRATLAREGEQAVVFYSSCGHESLPLWEVRARLEDGTVLRLEERFLPSEEERDTGPAALARAEVTIGGARREVADYWRLVYAAARHNTHVRYWVVLDRPGELPGLGGLVHALELEAPEPREGLPGTASYLGEGFELLRKVEVAAFTKSLLAEGGPPSFRRGDVDGDGTVGLSDAVRLLDYLFRRGAALPCARAADADDDGKLGITDAVWLLLHAVRGAALPAPYPGCGPDPTPDALSCAAGPPGC